MFGGMFCMRNPFQSRVFSPGSIHNWNSCILHFNIIPNTLSELWTNKWKRKWRLDWRWRIRTRRIKIATRKKFTVIKWNIYNEQIGSISGSTCSVIKDFDYKNFENFSEISSIDLKKFIRQQKAKILKMPDSRKNGQFSKYMTIIDQKSICVRSQSAIWTDF